MSTFLIVVLAALSLGVSGCYYGCNHYGRRGFGGAMGMVLIVLLVFWFFGGLHIKR